MVGKIKKDGSERIKSAKYIIGYIYAVLRNVFEKSLTEEEAMEMIREIIAR